MILSIYPVKLNEYFAAGLPVVATKLPELVKLAPLVHVAEDSSDFLRKVEVALSKNCAAGQEARIEFARRNTWEERAEKISQCILRKLTERNASASSLTSI